MISFYYFLLGCIGSAVLLIVGRIWFNKNLLSKLYHQVKTRKDLPAASTLISSSGDDTSLNVNNIHELPYVRTSLLETEVCYLQPGDHVFRKEALYHEKSAGKRTLDAIYLGHVSGTHYVVQYESSQDRDDKELFAMKRRRITKCLNDVLDRFALETEAGEEISQMRPKIQVVPFSSFLRGQQSFYVYLYNNSRYHNIDDTALGEIFSHVEKFKLDCDCCEQPALEERRFMIAPQDLKTIGKAPVTIFLKDSEAYECSREEQLNMSQFHGHGNMQEFTTMVEIPESEIKGLPRALSRTQIISRALQAVGFSQYDMNNCNSMHFSHWVCTGCSSLLKSACPEFWMPSPSKDHVCRIKHLVNTLFEDSFART